MKTCPLLLALAAGGCITVTPKGETVRVTDNGAEVANCKLLGTIRPNVPYLSRAEAIKQMRNQTGQDGGDVLLLTSSGWTRGDAGTEYSCGSKQTGAAKEPPRR